MGYLPMLLLAVSLPYLLVVVAGRGLGFAWFGPLLLVAVITQLAPSTWTGHSEWGRPVKIGAVPRWQETSGKQLAADLANTIRAEHLHSLGKGLTAVNASPVLTDDPLFTLRNGSTPDYAFLNQAVTTRREEWRVLREAQDTLGTRTLVTNVFGRDSFLRSYGYPALKAALSAHGQRRTIEVRYPQGTVVARQLSRSRSKTSDRLGAEYSVFRCVFGDSLCGLFVRAQAHLDLEVVVARAGAGSERGCSRTGKPAPARCRASRERPRR